MGATVPQCRPSAVRRHPGGTPGLRELKQTAARCYPGVSCPRNRRCRQPWGWLMDAAGGSPVLRGGWCRALPRTKPRMNTWAAALPGAGTAFVAGAISFLVVPSPCQTLCRASGERSSESRQRLPAPGGSALLVRAADTARLQCWGCWWPFDPKGQVSSSRSCLLCRLTLPVA